MKCDKCKETESKMTDLNAEIEAMFIHAFSIGFKIGSEKAVKAISDNAQGALNSGLFPELARFSMKEFFRKDNPSPVGEKDYKCQ